METAAQISGHDMAKKEGTLYFVSNSSHGEAAAIQVAIAESKAAVSCVDLADRDSFQRRERRFLNKDSS